eukprot:TRINITY_DN6222_c0_g1_i1.p1 TRINITY_DN6222_c0_g1~~TRINITY_DN6222_c0_g1_i1.p1  ORF type:complete len:205 (+),score=35.17 TRINITY_DN6222_c0_g1_i1:122-736(+)
MPAKSQLGKVDKIEQDLAELKDLVKKLAENKSAAVEEDDFEDEDCEEFEEVDDSELFNCLPINMAAPMTPLGRNLCRMATTAPPLERVKALMDGVQPYEGVPPTVKAVDNHTTVQNKLASIINLTVKYAEFGCDNAAILQQIVAVARSGYQDIIEVRRKAAVRGAEGVLKRRPDLQDTDVLSPKERAALSAARAKQSCSSSYRG